ncbi:hypothetical protein D918_00187 [Trichuris suis]|nr:hypothetical protein D918_00187 [Trichuris suis]
METICPHFLLECAVKQVRMLQISNPEVRVGLTRNRRVIQARRKPQHLEASCFETLRLVSFVIAESIAIIFLSIYAYDGAKSLNEKAIRDSWSAALSDIGIDEFNCCNSAVRAEAPRDEDEIRKCVSKINDDETSFTYASLIMHRSTLPPSRYYGSDARVHDSDHLAQK